MNEWMNEWMNEPIPSGMSKTLLLREEALKEERDTHTYIHTYIHTNTYIHKYQISQDYSTRIHTAMSGQYLCQSPFLKNLQALTDFLTELL